MENFNDEFGDLSGYKILSFEEVAQGFAGNKNPLLGVSGMLNSDKIEYINDGYINLTKLLEDIRSGYKKGNGDYMQYVFKEYNNNLLQTYIMDGNKHIDLSAKIYLKNGIVKVSTKLGRDNPRMEMLYDEKKRITYSLTFRYKDTHQDAIELRTHSFEEYKNLLLYLGYDNIEINREASSFFIREFTSFLEKPNNDSDNLYELYGDLPSSFLSRIHLPTETVVKHLITLTKEDDTGWFSWTIDTSSLLIKVMGMFRKFQEVADYFWKNPKFLTEIYDNLDGHSEVLGQFLPNRILFASVLNEFAKRDKNAKNKVTKNALLNGDGYFINVNILELNDTLNTIKGIMSFDWDFDYKKAVFLQQKRITTQEIEILETNSMGDSTGEKHTETTTKILDIDPGYLYHPMHLVHFLDKLQKPELVTALFIKAIADEKEWAEVMHCIRIGGDLIAIILGFISMGMSGEVSVLAVADIGLASVDLALMNEDVKKWLSQYPEGKWFVENWDSIYALVGAGIMSYVIMEGILVYGPDLLQKLKNLKNVKGNYLIFTKQLEKLIAELDAYKARIATNVIEEVVITAEKSGLLKKLLKPFLGADANIEYIVEQLAKRSISVKKAGDNLYEIYYKGKLVATADAKETGAFLRNNFYKTERQLEEVVDKITKAKRFDWAKFFDDLGGKILSRTEIEKLRTLLTEKGIHMIVETDTANIKSLFKPADGFDTADELFKFLREEEIIGGGFNPESLQTIFTKNPSELTVFHEMMHIQHYEEIGRAKYLVEDTLVKETYVWEKIYAAKERWTIDELQESLDYINGIRERYNLKPLNIKIK